MSVYIYEMHLHLKGIVMRFIIGVLTVVFAILLWYAILASGMKVLVYIEFGLGLYIILAILWHFKRKEFAFSFPYMVIDANVFNKREPKIDDVVDRYLNYSGISEIEKHLDVMRQWRSRCESLVEDQVKRKCFGSSARYRERQLTRLNYVSSESKPFCFEVIRIRDAPNFSYRVKYLSDRPAGVFYSYDELLERYKFLRGIDFACTRREYECKEQRKLMTKELRKKIMIRDNYTCQICGKYMPDEVGLQIDHIVPVVKGGKSIPSNLQVLCSKCNGSKSDKV